MTHKNSITLRHTASDGHVIALGFNSSLPTFWFCISSPRHELDDVPWDYGGDAPHSICTSRELKDALLKAHSDAIPSSDWARLSQFDMEAPHHA